jgi:molybdate transport system substrate-binding protein
MMQARRGVLTLAALLLACRFAAAQPLTVAAASDLQSALPAIVAQFQKDTGHQVRLTYGSSGNFFAQIQNGAPFDVFLSADLEYPRRLERLGQAEPGSLYKYATGRLVLWTRKDTGIDVRRGLSVLADGSVRRVAIANPAHAPYGKAAVAALHYGGLFDQVQTKLVFGENILQTAQFVQSGSVDVGLLALSLALTPPLKSIGTYVEVPRFWYPPIEQAAVVLASSRQKALAQQFVDYLKKPDSVRILQSFGFAVSQTPGR